MNNYEIIPYFYNHLIFFSNNFRILNIEKNKNFIIILYIIKQELNKLNFINKNKIDRKLLTKILMSM